MMLYLVYGLKRGGHHAVIGWLCKQIGDIKHLNDIKCDSEKNELLRDSYHTKTHHVRMYESKFPNRFPIHILIEKENYPISFGKFGFSDYRLMDFTNLMISAENKEVGSLNPLKEFFETDRDIYIVRDYFNMKASILKKGSIIKNNLDRLWKSYIYHCENSDSLMINFNRWFVDERYRRDICDTLNIQFTDVAKNKMLYTGSSFDGKKYLDNPEGMDILGRYKKYGMNKLCKDKEIFELHERYFEDYME